MDVFPGGYLPSFNNLSFIKCSLDSRSFSIKRPWFFLVSQAVVSGFSQPELRGEQLNFANLASIAQLVQCIPQSLQDISQPSSNCLATERTLRDVFDFFRNSHIWALFDASKDVEENITYMYTLAINMFMYIWCANQHHSIMGSIYNGYKFPDQRLEHSWIVLIQPELIQHATKKLVSSLEAPCDRSACWIS